MHIIEVKEIRTFSYHGCLPEEALIGGEYTIDVKLYANLIEACESDSLDQTIDYVIVNKIVEEEMSIKSNLIENVAMRIAQKLKLTFSILKKVKVKVVKLNPPINGDVRHVAFTICI